MADILKGKLIFKGEGKERKRHLVFTTRKGKMWDNPVGPDRLALNLHDSTEAEIVVELETDPQSGQPYRVRREGQAWVESAPTAQRAQSAARIGGGKHMPGKGSHNKQQSWKQDRGNPQSNSPNKKPEFHNPYNFIPALRRDNDRVKKSGLGDSQPAGHDRYYHGLYSGQLRVKMTVATPLLLPDTARVKITGQGKTEHRSYPVRVDARGNPYIEPTAIKGMLRSAYEAATNSRMSVFQKHDERLAFRGEAMMPCAARIEMHKGSLHIRRFATLPVVLVRYRKHWRGEKDKLESNDTTQTPVVSGRAMKYSGSTNLPQHGEPVWVKFSNRIATKGRMAGRSIGRKVDEILPRTIGAATPSGFEAGWACVTGANAKDKVYERVFLELSSDWFIPLSDDHRAIWNELISNYQMIHEEDLQKRERAKEKPNDYLGNDPGQTAWSRHIFDKDALKLREGTLCYGIEQGGSIKALLPVMISRRLYDVSPAKLLPEGLHPAQRLAALSPADRVFGWVSQEGKGAYRGQLRIGTVECESSWQGTIEKFADPGLPLAILGQPKPQQGRFYVAADKTGEAQQKGLNTEQAGYNDLAKGLRGRKVYPHHHLTIKGEGESYLKKSKDYWDVAKDHRLTPLDARGSKIYQEYRRPPKNGQECDNQNRSVHGWITPDTVFRFDIHFMNLSAAELGALVWLLQLPDQSFHRFGGGKPLGFGSVRLELVGQESDVCSGVELMKRYKSLDDDQSNKCDVTDLVAAFKKAIWSAYGSDFREKGDQETAEEYQKLIDRKFNEVRFIAAFLRAAQGFNDKLPIHYPRTTREPHPDGESFKWFVENASSTKEGVRHGYALGNLADDAGLPILEER